MIKAESASRAFLARWACAATLFCTAWMGAGCGRSAPSDADDGSPDVAGQSVTRPAPRRALTDFDQSRLIQVVRQSRPRPGGPTVDEWVESRVANAGGPLLYSDWTISPGNDGMHKVKFSYTWRSSGFEIMKDTLTWTVAEDTRTVTGPLEETTNDESSPVDLQVEGQPTVDPAANATDPSP